MPDHAHSTSPAVQAQLHRLGTLSPGRDTLGLERISALCERLGKPQDRLPPVFHVAGTNGKGSTCAFLRAMLEAAGHTVHVYTSPHLVRFNERIRLTGSLIGDADLATTLARTLDAAEGLNASFFEITTAATFLRFSEEPSDACVIEVGLGGRLDATNIIPRPLVTGIASLALDHHEFLLSADPDVPDMPDLERIAFEKAGIAKPGVPLVTLDYPPAIAAQLASRAERAGATLMMRGRHWRSQPIGRGFLIADRHGKLFADPPALPGAHQLDNAALAIAMLHAQPILEIPDAAVQRGLGSVSWSARLQRLRPGPLAGDRSVWLDGGHNADAAMALAAHLAAIGPVDLIVGMLANKDAQGFLRILAPHVTRFAAVPITGHACHDPASIVAMLTDRDGYACATLADATTVMGAGKPERPLLIAGSLYLAGEALSLNEQVPD
jgi:dihydrofolate synthase / folylpolyglutamate synthase